MSHFDTGLVMGWREDETDGIVLAVQVRDREGKPTGMVERRIEMRGGGMLVALEDTRMINRSQEQIRAAFQASGLASASRLQASEISDSHRVDGARVDDLEAKVVQLLERIENLEREVESGQAKLASFEALATRFEESSVVDDRAVKDLPLDSPVDPVPAAPEPVAATAPTRRPGRKPASRA
jgi:hypothetical protein